jgi:hypothetical protein
VNTPACDRERDVFEAMMSGRWPPVNSGDPGEQALREHVDGCPICGDLAIVAAVFQDDRDFVSGVSGVSRVSEVSGTSGDAHVPTSGQVWWRASMRTRAEAAATAARPITMLQGLAGACAAGLCAALVTVAWPSVQQPLAGIADMLSRGAQRFDAAAVSAAAMQQALLSVLAVAGASLILASLILYLALSDD